MTLKESITKTRYGWTLIVFGVLTLFISSLYVWQLITLSPRGWCALAEATSPENTTACLSVLVKLIEAKDHSLITLGVILGVTVVSVLAIAFGLKISAAGPGGTSVNIDADETRVDTPGASVVVPTPPQEEKK